MDENKNNVIQTRNMGGTPVNKIIIDKPSTMYQY